MTVTLRDPSGLPSRLTTTTDRTGAWHVQQTVTAPGTERVTATGAFSGLTLSTSATVV